MIGELTVCVHHEEMVVLLKMDTVSIHTLYVSLKAIQGIELSLLKVTAYI